MAALSTDEIATTIETSKGALDVHRDLARFVRSLGGEIEAAELDRILGNLVEDIETMKGKDREDRKLPGLLDVRGCPPAMIALVPMTVGEVREMLATKHGIERG